MSIDPSLGDKTAITRTASCYQLASANEQQFQVDRGHGLTYPPGERISTTLVESAINQIIDKCMFRSQQMRWSWHSAHLLSQVRTGVLNGRLALRCREIVFRLLS
jgi:hypothetical protein